MATDLQRAAIDLARQGVSVLPLKYHAKEPDGFLVRHGHLDATDDVDEVGTWWERFPDNNVGIACQASQLLVIDVDERNGGTVPNCLPETLTVATPGGCHLYYHVPDPAYEPVSAAGAGIDVKWNGYVVAPPSVHPSGDVYAVERQTSVVPLPDDIMEFLAR